MTDKQQQPDRTWGDSIRPRPSSRREFLVAGGGTLAGLLVLGLAACGGDDDGSTGGGGEVVLSITANLEPTVKKQVERFNGQHPDGPKLSLRVMSVDTDQYFQQLRTMFQAGGGEIGVIAGDVIWPAQFAQPGWISDLGDRFTSDEQEQYLPGAIEAMEYQGGIYGVPWYTDSGLLYYRQDLLEDAGFDEPPKTWDELKEMATKIQSDADVESGFVFTGARYEGGTVLGTEFIRNAGGDILDGDTVVIGSPEAVEGLKIQASLVSEGIAPKAVANFKEDEATGAFLRGDSAFMRMWPYAYDLLSDQEQSKLDPKQVGLTQVPVASAEIQPTNVGGGWNFYLNSSSDDPDAAWEVIQFMSAAKQQKELALDQSLLPTREEVYDDQELLDALPAVSLGKAAFLNTTTPPVSPYYSDMSLAMAKQFNANILGDVAPEEAAETLQGELESINERWG